MISEIHIENFKSIASLTLEPGDVTVLIGENGSGKSNILEAIAFAAAASVDKLDDEFLFNRGVRVTGKNETLGREGVSGPKTAFGSSSFHQAAFQFYGEEPGDKLRMNVTFLGHPNFETPWVVTFDGGPEEEEIKFDSPEATKIVADWKQYFLKFDPEVGKNEYFDQMVLPLVVSDLLKGKAPTISAEIGLRDFLIYAPENTALRNFETEGAIKPLGTKGEGLLKLLTLMAESDKGKFSKELNSHLQLLGWFGELHLPTENDKLRGRVRIRDRYLGKKGPVFDQRSANEGFLYLLFYFTLMLSKQTPVFFAIDNIDNALNPKLCAELIRQLAKLAKKMGKQMICTTHNPAILDGLNLKDDRQRLYVVRRDSQGHTVANQVKPPRPRPDGPPVKLSEAFMSGLLGGLPEHF